MKNQYKQHNSKGIILWLTITGVMVFGAQIYAQEADSALTADLTQMSIDELMNIEVASTATLTKTTPRLVPSAMTTITEEQIKGSGARNLFELLDIYVPNFQWIRDHWEADHMGLRGINSADDKYLLLVNGRVMNERTHFGAVTERDLVLLRDIHHIDVIRGPGSALYGPGAISMVINIITHNANTFQGTEITGRLGAVEEFYSAELKHGLPFEDNDGGLFVYAGVGNYPGASKYDAPQIFAFDFPSVSQYQWWDPAWGDMPVLVPSLPADGTQAGEPATGPAFNRDNEDARGVLPMKLHAEVTKGDWDIWARYTRGGKKILWDTGILARDPWGWADWVPLKNQSYSYQQATGYIGYQQELFEGLDIDYAFSYMLTGYARYTVDLLQENYREDQYYGKILSRWQPNEQHKIALGTELLHIEHGLENIFSAYGSDTISPRFVSTVRLDGMERWSTNLYSILGEWQWNISDKWTTFAGARLDDHTYTDWLFSPRAAIVYSPSNKDTLKLMWSRSVRANSGEEMRAQTDDPNNLDISKPEKLDTVEFRYERTCNENLDVAASLFMHYNFEIISWNNTNNSLVGTQKDWGAELEVSYHNDKTRFLMSHGYTKLLDFDLQPDRWTFITAKPQGYGDDLASWSNHVTKLIAQHKLSDKWTLDASLRIYWGFPGMKDYNKYDPYRGNDAEPDYPVIEDGWEKAYRGNYYLNLGLQYKPSDDLTVGIVGYNLLGIFDKDLNKRNYLGSFGDYRSHAPAVGVSLEYKF